MKVIEFIEKTGLTSDAARIIEQTHLSATEADALGKLYETDRQAFFAAVNEKENKFQLYLKIFCMKALETYERYRESKISDEVFFDTFSDFALWNRICVEETGVCGLAEYEWLTNHLDMKIFKLGRLQFQHTVCESPINTNKLNVAEGDSGFNVHIPRGGPLSPEVVSASIEQAKQFFNKPNLLLFCESWLLSPKLDAILGKESNIIRFKNMFEVYEVDLNSRSCERYVFGKFCQDYLQYRPYNSLSQKIYELLKKGEAIGTGCGVCLI